MPPFISTVTLSPEGGTPANGGNMVWRRCDFSQVAFVLAIPGSTSEAQKKPFSQSRLGYLLGVIDRPDEGKTEERETLEPSAVA